MATERQPLNTWSWGNNLRGLLRTPFVPRDFRRPYGAQAIARQEFFGDQGAPPSGVLGDASIVENADAIATAGAVILTGASASTEVADTTSATAILALLSAADMLEAVDTVVADALIVLSGEGLIPEEQDTLVAALVMALIGGASLQEADDTMAAYSGTVGSKTCCTRARNLLMG